MKNFISKSVILFVIVAFLGCSSDSPTPCTPIVCKNAGVSTPDCGCNCPDGYTGSDCSVKKTPSKILVTKIQVKKFPNTNGSTNWDTSDAPDIFIRLGKGSTPPIELLFQSNVITNVLSDGITIYEFTPPINIEIINLASTHTIALYDYDSISYDDLMGGFTFTPNNFIDGFPTSIKLQDTSKPLSFEIFVTYIF